MREKESLMRIVKNCVANKERDASIVSSQASEPITAIKTFPSGAEDDEEEREEEKRSRPRSLE